MNEARKFMDNWLETKEEKMSEFSKEEIGLWTISKCVDYLREKGCNNYLYLLHHKTPLKACQEAVLKESHGRN